MLTIREYKKAESLEEAYTLNQKKSNRVIGGMIWLKMETLNVGTAIDLSGLGLDTIEETDTEFRIVNIRYILSLSGECVIFSVYYIYFTTKSAIMPL